MEFTQEGGTKLDFLTYKAANMSGRTRRPRLPGKFEQEVTDTDLIEQEETEIAEEVER